MSFATSSKPEQLITNNLDVWTSAIKKRGSQGRGSSKKIELYGIKKLRELILDLAVRGLLVPQDPNDEPASVLLEKVADKKVELATSGEIKKQKPLMPVGVDEELFKLPAGWSWSRIGEFSLIGPRNNLDDNLEVSFVPMPLVSTSYKGDHGQEVRVWSELKKGYTHFSDGDIGLAKITPCFENSKASVFTNLKNGFGAGTTELHIARPFLEEINPLFILLYLKSPMFLEVGKTKMTGSAGQKRIPKSFFEGNPFPLPPEAEQPRIVAKVDELMALCDQLEQQTEDSLSAHQTLVETLLNALLDAAQSRDDSSSKESAFDQAWQRIAEHFDVLFTTGPCGEWSIDQLKQTILQLAVMGKLVPQDPNDEPASVLLEKIAAEKERLVKEGKIKKQKPLPEISEDEKPFELPVGWLMVRLGQLINLISGQHLKPSEYVDTPTKDTVPYITGPAEFGQHHPSYSKYTEQKRALANDGDILITCKGSGIGKQNTANETIAISRQLMAIQPVGVSGDYIRLITASLYDYFQSKGVGIAIPGISREDITEVVSMLPPFAEQYRIVSKVDRLMTLCDNLKARINKSQTTQLHLADAMAEQALN